MAINKGSVKGSRHEELVVQAHEPGKRAQKRAFIVLALVLVGAVSFVAGFYGSLAKIELLINERDALVVELTEVTAQNQELTQIAGILTKGGEIDRQAVNSVREEILSLETQIVALEEEVAFYKNIMAPDRSQKGLSLGQPDLKIDRDGGYRFRVALSQLGDHRKSLSGRVAVTVTYEEKGTLHQRPLHELASGQDPKGILFKFRYFQDISGHFVLADGQVLKSLTLAATTSGKKPVTKTTSIDWPL